MSTARAHRARPAVWALVLFLVAQGAAAARLGGDFTLQSSEGEVSLAALRGKVVPIYFGYMSCPDLCPMTLSVLGAALGQLQAAELEQVQALFVSLDPERDDPARLAEYARYFHPRITGVTGSPAVLQDLARRYRVSFARVPGNTAESYTLDHTSRLVLVDPEGKMRRLLADGTPADAVASAIRALLAR